MRVLVVAAYLISTVLAIIAIDANSGGTLGAVWLLMALLLGAATGKLRFALLPFLAIPIAIPFGLPAEPGDPAFPVWIGAVYLAWISAGLVILAAVARQVFDHRRSPKGL